MRVKRDFERIYQEEDDPWAIGDATSHRYERYRERLLGYRRGGSLLDIGCGLGAFLARFAGEFDELVGVETSAEAVRRARELRPQITFVHADARGLASTEVEGRRFEAIVLSDVVYYLPERERRRLLDWVNAHLAPDGVALVAAWCPGGRYLTADELVALVGDSLRIREEERLESGHVLLLCDRKRRLVALTFDYETWQPIPEGRRIDWGQDVFAPAAALLDAADAAEIPVTLFAELGEYFWLDENRPELARRMEDQWRDAVRRGHDVQLHLHPDWLPETGAACVDGDWRWDARYAKADDYPGDLDEVIRRCVDRLEIVLRPVDPTYEVTCFRAGAYRAQPFRRLSSALTAAGVRCDSSVYAGGVSTDRGYDYSHAWSDRQPYFASPWDPQLPAVPAEEQIVELPVCVVGRSRVMLDGPDGAKLEGRILSAFRRGRTSERRRLRATAGLAAGRGYRALTRAHRGLSLLLPKALTGLVSEIGAGPATGHDYAVAIGHTKGDLRPTDVIESARRLRDHGIEVVRMTELAALAGRELLDRPRPAGPGPRLDERVLRHARRLIPLDRERLLALDGSAAVLPWARVTNSAPTSLPLAFPEAAFDCIDAGDALVRADDVDRLLRELHRVLAEGGALVAAVPSDARNPARRLEQHTWKTVPHDVEARLADAGFVDISVREIDVLRSLGASPYPPGNDRVSLVRAWRRTEPATQLTRVQEAMDWLYEKITPGASPVSNDPITVISSGTALCGGYAISLFELLRREGFDARIVEMETKGHPRGRGPEGVDTHVVVQARVDGRPMMLDPMANTIIPHALRELLHDPSLAPGRRVPDERHRSRGYELYDSAFWYGRVTRYRLSSGPRSLARWHSVRPRDRC